MKASRIKKLVAVATVAAIALTSMSLSAFAVGGEASSFSTGGEATLQPFVSAESQISKIKNDPNLTNAQKERNIAKITRSEVAADSNSTGGEATLQPIITAEDQIRDIENDPSLTTAQKERTINKLTHAIPPRESRATAKTLNVPFIAQESTYYCGPATVKQTLQFLTGSAKSQADIAAAIGTTSADGSSLTNMVSYINGYLTSKYVIVNSPSSSAVMYSDMVDSIDNYNMPPIPSIKVTSDMVNSSRGFKYTTNGHFLNVSGYDSSNSSDRELQVTDPYLDGHKVSSGKYYVHEKELYAAIMANPNHRFAY